MRSTKPVSFRDHFDLLESSAPARLMLASQCVQEAPVATELVDGEVHEHEHWMTVLAVLECHHNLLRGQVTDGQAQRAPLHDVDVHPMFAERCQLAIDKGGVQVPFRKRYGLQCLAHAI